MKYYIEDLPHQSLKDLVKEMYECEVLAMIYPFKFKPFLDVQGWEEADEVAFLREYMEILGDTITDKRYEREMEKVV